jgi:hypothetical protein
MKLEYWILLGLGILLIIFSKSGAPFSGLTSQRGNFGTPGTPVDNYYD